MSDPTPRFTGIFIPVEILEHPKLTMLEQLLLAWIDALYCKTHHGCYAKNEYFAEKLKVKENTIAKALTSLRQKNLVEDVSFDGRNRVIRAKLGEFVDKAQSKAELDLNPKQGWTKIQGSIGRKSIPTYIESKEENKEHKEGSSTPPSATAEGLLDAFLSKIKERNPEFKDPNRPVWLADMDKLLRIDKRSVEKTKEIIIWASTHKWFKTACLSPAKLRKDYDSMLMQMEAGKEEQIVVINRQFALGLKEKYPDRMKTLFFDKNFVGNRETGKEIPFKLPIEQFKELFIPLFGGAYAS